MLIETRPAPVSKPKASTRRPNGGSPKPVTSFKSLWLYGYAPSPDGKQLVLSRGDQYQVIVLIKGFR